MEIKFMQGLPAVLSCCVLPGSRLALPVCTFAYSAPTMVFLSIKSDKGPTAPQRQL